MNYHSDAPVPSAIIPNRRGLGAPLSAEKLQAKKDAEWAEEEARQVPSAPLAPYRADSTGIDTHKLPKPPARAVGFNGAGGGASPASKPKPKLPPRLPPRQNSHPGEKAPSPPPTYSAATQKSPPDGYTNQGAAGRLGQAGVSVPGLGIGRPSSPQEQGSNPWRNESSAAAPSSGLGGLQSRFSSLKTTAAPPAAHSPTSPPPAQGTTWQEKQAAMKTASSFRNDPSTISMADAKATANTANNFRERHGEQVSKGWKVGDGLNKKYGIADKVNSYTGNTNGAGLGATSPAVADNAAAGHGVSNGGGGFGQAAAAFGGFKKAPPPPPTRRITGGAASPPPVPLGSKPR